MESACSGLSTILLKGGGAYEGASAGTFMAASWFGRLTRTVAAGGFRQAALDGTFAGGPQLEKNLNGIVDLAFRPLPACPAGEAVCQARSVSQTPIFDPCRLVRQVKQFAGLDDTLA